MASRNIDDLKREMRPQVRNLIAACLGRGFSMVPFQTLRDPYEQARVWRSSRGKVEIASAHAMLMDRGADFLAKVLMDVGPQFPPPGVRGHRTRALPGQSWHQWGEAVDCFLKVDGEAIWDAKHEGYAVYIEEAETLGLYPGPKWDAVHVQCRRGVVLSTFSSRGGWGYINAEMARRCSLGDPSDLSERKSD